MIPNATLAKPRQFERREEQAEKTSTDLQMVVTTPFEGKAGDHSGFPQPKGSKGLNTNPQSFEASLVGRDERNTTVPVWMAHLVATWL
jgi:hypothetical protein